MSIIVPARNEQISLGACLESLIAQADVSLEIIVVDDGSSDGTRKIAESFAGVQIISAGALRSGWTGKNNAIFGGAAVARGEWLLFTDADSVHSAGSLARALGEARRNDAALLSYSPEQEVRGFWEKAVMPVIFAELAAAYRPADVSDPASAQAAANGQYILISREAYAAVGGHAYQFRHPAPRQRCPFRRKLRQRDDAARRRRASAGGGFAVLHGVVHDPAGDEAAIATAVGSLTLPTAAAPSSDRRTRGPRACGIMACRDARKG